MDLARDVGVVSQRISSAGEAGAILALGEELEGAVEAPSR
jgi:hypothetical protein